MTNKMSKTVIIGSIVCSLVLIGVLSTYSYIILSPTETKEDLGVEAGTLDLTFADGNNGITEALEFGSSVEKTFTIENTGTLDAWAKINFDDLINTYIDGSLTYTLSYSDTESGNYTELVNKINVPRSDTPTIKTLTDFLNIPSGAKYYYKLTITLNYLDDIDQTADLKAIFSTHFKLEQGTAKYTITFDDGNEETITKEVIENATYGELPQPTKEGCVFKGWYTAPNGEGEHITSNTVVNITSNKRLYAYYKKVGVEETLKVLNANINIETINYNYTSPLPTFQDNGFTEVMSSGQIVGCSDTNYYCYATSYNFDIHTGLYELVNPTRGIANNIHSQMSNKYAVGCYYNNTTELLSIKKYVNYSSLCQYTYQNVITPTIVSYVENSGLYKIESNNETSYFYRGDINNNFVKFANFYWRILKINSNGSIKLVYDGTTPHENGEKSTDRIATENVKYNNYANDDKYTGYMFGGTAGTKSTSKEQAQTNQTNSNIKTELEKWYTSNIEKNDFDRFVSDEVFCNDRTTTNQGYGSSSSGYAYNRLYTEKNPNLSCNSNDSFTVSAEKGNGKLSKPVGLITADELSIAGMRYNVNNTRSYLFKGAHYWTMSPWNGNVTVFTNTGSINGYEETSSSIGLVPVINLSAEYVSDLLGDGTMTNPYHLQNESIN